jgi:hypothetical protein
MKTTMNQIAVLSVAVVLASSCSIITGKSSGQSKKFYSSPDDDPSAATIGTRNFLQLKASMERATNVPTTTDAATVNLYNSSVSRLSLDGAPLSVNASMILATTTLASSYCNKAVSNERASAAARVLFGSVNFATGPAGLTDSIKNDVITKVASRFWGRSPTPEERATLLLAMSETASSVSVPFTRPNSATPVTLSQNQQVDAILLVACTAAGGSLEFLRS